LNLVKQADLVIICAGTNFYIESEGNDRVDISLPGLQEQMVQDVYAAGATTVLVLMNAGSVSIQWSKENLPAIVEAWFGGEHAGTALTDVLFGNYNPAGRLPTTWYNSVNDLPPYVNYSMDGRTYRYYHKEPLYPFGYGLSYSRFRYENVTLSADTIKPCDYLEVTTAVRNLGPLDGDEVVQVYISNREASVPVPIRQLIGVSRIHLKNGETKQVQFVLTPEQLSVIAEYNWEKVIEPGHFIVTVGGQQPDQITRAPSNVLQTSFDVVGSVTPLKQCATSPARNSESVVIIHS